ncbi:hypothetical protein C8T65DRAFT_666255 [Cerioporus squamosus]|nr:hypothetical protein C8T65DRAFT_666255 [Cerioporus squamosus]
MRNAPTRDTTSSPLRRATSSLPLYTRRPLSTLWTNSSSSANLSAIPRAMRPGCSTPMLPSTPNAMGPGSPPSTALLRSGHLIPCDSPLPSFLSINPTLFPRLSLRLIW